MTTTEQPIRISRDERRELKSIIRNQFKVTAAEVQQRKAAMDAEVEARLRERFKDLEAAKAKFEADVARLRAETERKLRRLIDTCELNNYEGHWDKPYSEPVRLFPPTYVTEKRNRMATFIRTRINVELRTVELGLARQEADLLRELAVDALVSSEAIRFLHSVPTSESLMPAGRVLALEADFDAGNNT